MSTLKYQSEADNWSQLHLGNVTKTDDGSKMPPRGLHHCRYYDNLVRYNPNLCGKCSHNGFRPREDDGEDADTCF
ncbi:hypothetical protein ISS40_09695 [Candidatus Bathyarchaeota archaeon]|nr:hypothetical protein [Candidatus Bathyarchaeota archaeon]